MGADSEGSAYPLTFPTNAENSVSARRDGDDPAVVWAALAPLIAAKPRVRVSRDGGKNYHARWERTLTNELPRTPAAVPLYSAGGDTRCLVIDLDTSKGGREVVLRDAAALTQLIGRCGGAVIADESPSGGVHLYLPLQQPVAFHEARDAALALAARTPSMDPAPNTNLLAGLIRPPGSPHKSGGHQTLRTTLAAAHRIATVRNAPAVWQKLTASLRTDIAAIAAQRDTAPSDADYVPRPGGPREITGDYLRIATHGIYDTSRYASPSEARQAVVTSAVWAGYTLTGLLARIENGRWPGLASFYARYSPGHRAKAVTRDWQNAVALVTKKKRENNQGEKPVQKSPTSLPPSHRQALGSSASRLQNQARGSQAEYQFIRSWWTALAAEEHQRYTKRDGPALRMVLRALGEAAMKSGSRYIAFGTRSIALATGLDHTTVAAHLRRLRSEKEPLVVLIENDRGLQADLYEITIPERLATRAETASWRPGKLHALRPAFRELGLPAAFVYEALEIAREPLSSMELVTPSGMSRSSVYEALETLAAYNLVEQRAGRWSIVATTSLQALADQLGCIDDVETQLAAYRVERAAYRAVFGVITPWEPEVEPMSWPRRIEPPPDGEFDYTVIELLQDRLGAQLITPEEFTAAGGTP